MSMRYVEISELRRRGLTDEEIVRLCRDFTKAKLIVGEGKRGTGIVPADYGDFRGSLCTCEHFAVAIYDDTLFPELKSY